MFSENKYNTKTHTHTNTQMMHLLLKIAVLTQNDQFRVKCQHQYGIYNIQ